MADINYKVDVDELESSYEVLPAGTYTVVIEDSSWNENKQGTGEILKLTYQVIDGPKKGQKLFNNLNINHVNKTAEQIARKALNSIGVACNVLHIKDSAQLHNIPFKIEVTVKDSEDYGKQNNIKKHMPLTEKPAGAGAAAKTAAAFSGSEEEAPLSGNTDKPWLRK